VAEFARILPAGLLALLPSGFGVIMGMAGLFVWGIHPDALIKLLS
jgi:hypothetical protein